MSLPDNYKIQPYGDSFIPFFRDASAIGKELELPAGANGVSQEEANRIIDQLVRERGGTASDYAERQTLYLRDIPMDIQTTVGDRDVASNWCSQNFSQVLEKYLNNPTEDLTNDLREREIAYQLLKTQQDPEKVRNLSPTDQFALVNELLKKKADIYGEMLELAAAHNIQALVYMPEMLIGSAEDAINIGFSNQYQASILTRLYNTNEAWKSAIEQRLWGGMVQQAKSDPVQFVMDMGVGAFLAKGTTKVKTTVLPKAKTYTTWTGDVVVETDKGTITAAPNDIVGAVKDKFGIRTPPGVTSTLDTLKRFYTGYTKINNVWTKGMFNFPVMMQASEQQIERVKDTTERYTSKEIIDSLETLGNAGKKDLSNIATVTADELARLTGRQQQIIKALQASGKWDQGIAPVLYALREWKFDAASGIPTAEVLLSRLRIQTNDAKYWITAQVTDAFQREPVITRILEASKTQNSVSTWEIAKVLVSEHLIDEKELKTLYTHLINTLPQTDKQKLPPSKGITEGIEYQDIRNLQTQFSVDKEASGVYDPVTGLLSATQTSLGGIPTRVATEANNIITDLRGTRQLKSHDGLWYGNAGVNDDIFGVPKVTENTVQLSREQLEGMTVKEYNQVMSNIRDNQFIAGLGLPADLGGGTAAQVARDFQEAESMYTGKTGTTSASGLRTKTWYQSAGYPVLAADALAHGLLPGTAEWNNYMKIQKNANGADLLEFNYNQNRAIGGLATDTQTIQTLKTSTGIVKTWTSAQDAIYKTNKAMWDKGTLLAKAYKEMEDTQLELSRTQDTRLQTKLNAMGSWIRILQKSGKTGEMSYFDYVQLSAEWAAKGQPNPFMQGYDYLVGEGAKFNTEMGPAKWQRYQQELGSLGGTITENTEAYLASFLAREKLYEMGDKSGIDGTSPLNQALYSTRAVIPFDLGNILSSLNVDNPAEYIKNYQSQTYQKIAEKAAGYLSGLYNTGKINSKGIRTKEAINADGTIDRTSPGFLSFVGGQQENLYLKQMVSMMSSMRGVWDSYTAEEKQNFEYILTHDKELGIFGDMPTWDKSNQRYRMVTDNLKRTKEIFTRFSEGELNVKNLLNGDTIWNDAALVRRKIMGGYEYVTGENEDQYRTASDRTYDSEDSLGDTYYGNEFVAGSGTKGITVPLTQLGAISAAGNTTFMGGNATGAQENIGSRVNSFLAGLLGIGTVSAGATDMDVGSVQLGGSDLTSVGSPNTAANLTAPAATTAESNPIVRSTREFYTANDLIPGTYKLSGWMQERVESDANGLGGTGNIDYSFIIGTKLVVRYKDGSNTIFDAATNGIIGGSGRDSGKQISDLVKEVGGTESDIKWVTPSANALKNQFGMTKSEFTQRNNQYVQGIPQKYLMFSSDWIDQTAGYRQGSDNHGAGTGNAGGGSLKGLKAFTAVDYSKVTAMYRRVINNEDIYLFVMNDGTTRAKRGGPTEGFKPSNSAEAGWFAQMTQQQGADFFFASGGSEALNTVDPLTGLTRAGSNDSARAAVSQADLSTNWTKLNGPLVDTTQTGGILNIQQLQSTLQSVTQLVQGQNTTSGATEAPVVTSKGTTGTSANTLAAGVVQPGKRSDAQAATDEGQITEGQVDKLASIVADAAYIKVLEKFKVQVIAGSS